MGKKLKLINLPYFLTSQVEKYIEFSENSEVFKGER